jgi:hypothetical protein
MRENSRGVLSEFALTVADLAVCQYNPGQDVGRALRTNHNCKESNRS